MKEKLATYSLIVFAKKTEVYWAQERVLVTPF